MRGQVTTNTIIDMNICMHLEEYDTTYSRCVYLIKARDNQVLLVYLGLQSMFFENRVFSNKKKNTTTRITTWQKSWFNHQEMLQVLAKKHILLPRDDER